MKLPRSIRFELECHCTVDFDRGISPPKIGDVIWCRGCQDVRMVKARVEEYCVKCADCRLVKYFGRAQITAQISADKHARKKEHVVHLYWGNELVDTRRPQHGQLELALDLDKPPPF